MNSIDGVSAIALVLIASFVIDRTVTGILFVLSFFKAWTRFFPDAAEETDVIKRARATKRQKLVYFLIAGTLGIVVLAGYGEVRILESLLGRRVNPTLDVILTGLTVVAGADRVAGFLSMRDGAEASKGGSRGIEVTGSLVLKRGSERDELS